MHLESLFTEKDLLINIRQIARVSVNPDYQKVTIAYANNGNISYLVLTKNKVNCNELLCFLESCLPNINSTKMTFVQLNQLHESLLEIYSTLAKLN